MNSDEDRSYTIIVDFIKSYNFVVHTFCLKSFDAQIINTIFISKI
jgi:hypothetical protein